MFPIMEKIHSEGTNVPARHIVNPITLNMFLNKANAFPQYIKYR